MKLKLVFADAADGMKYYQNENGDIVNWRGELVNVTAEMNVRFMVLNAWRNVKPQSGGYNE